MRWPWIIEDEPLRKYALILDRALAEEIKARMALEIRVQALEKALEATQRDAGHTLKKTGKEVDEITHFLSELLDLLEAYFKQPDYTESELHLKDAQAWRAEMAELEEKGDD